MWRRRRDVHRALSPQEVGALDSFCLGDKLKFKLECLVSEALGAAMTRRVFILGGAGLVFTHVILGDLGVARSDSAVDGLSLPESIEFNVKAIDCRGVRTRSLTITSRNICRQVRRVSVSNGWC